MGLLAPPGDLYIIPSLWRLSLKTSNSALETADPPKSGDVRSIFEANMQSYANRQVGYVIWMYFQYIQHYTLDRDTP